MFKVGDVVRLETVRNKWDKNVLAHFSMPLIVLDVTGKSFRLGRLDKAPIMYECDGVINGELHGTASDHFIVDKFLTAARDAIETE